jgi:hypothetical protein
MESAHTPTGFGNRGSFYDEEEKEDPKSWFSTILT